MIELFETSSAYTGSSSIDVPFGAYEREFLRAVVVSYVRNAARAPAENGTHDRFLNWYTAHYKDLGGSLPAVAKAGRNTAAARASRRSAIQILAGKLGDPQAINASKSAFQKRLDWVTSTLALSPRDAICLSLICRFTQISHFKKFAGSVVECSGDNDEVNIRVLAPVLGWKFQKLTELCSSSGRLQQLGLIEDRTFGDFAPSGLLLQLLRKRTSDPAELEQSLLGVEFHATLEMQDFDHIAKQRDETIRILRGAITKKAEGVGVLFHGAPGTGKTEFAAMLGQACKARVVFVGELNEDGKEPSRSDRLAHFAMISAIGSRAGKIIMVVDEADDIFLGVDAGLSERRRGSKVFINRMIEACPVPTVWISNHPELLGEAVIRRMTTAIEFPMPDRQIRKRMIARQIASQDIELDETSHNSLADLESAPAIFQLAIRAATLGNGEGSMAVTAARALHKAMGRVLPPATLPAPAAYDASLSSADLDLVTLEEKVLAAGPGGLSFLFSGLPGTGKTAFARHLASRLNMEILQKRGSDILGKYVGETEEKISEAFSEAAETRKFLIFDEANSLLSDRRDATHSWEVGHVNEMLSWMESHPLPFAMTTNLIDRLDPAVNRRFLFKVRFQPMNSAQLKMAFRKFFAIDPRCNLSHLENLTPGDFSIVARKAKVLQISDEATITDLLMAEVEAKSLARRKIGF